MSDLKKVLMYVSYSMGPFLKNFISYTLLFFSVISVAVIGFFFNFRTFRSGIFFLILVVVLWGITIKIRQIIFVRRQLELNVDFIDFLSKFESGSPGFTKAKVNEGLSPARKDFLSLLEDERKKVDSKFISAHLLVSLTAARIAGLGFISDRVTSNGSMIAGLKRHTLRSFLFENLIILILLGPFILISFLLTASFGQEIRLLVYFIGFLFVLFLDSVVVKPLIALVIQNRVINKSRSL